MKWFTHQSIAVAAAVAMNMPPLGIATVMIGAVLPDVIDQRIARVSTRPEQTFMRIHRKFSHWYGWYLLLFLFGTWGHVADLPAFLGNSQMKQNMLLLCAGLGFGGLSHVVLDMLTPMGVPYAPIFCHKRFSLRLCATGSVGEYVFLGCSLLAIFVYMSL